MNSWIGVTARVLTAAALVFLAWLALQLGFGAAEGIGDAGNDYFVESEWVFLFSVILGAACIWSAVLVAMGWRREDYPGLPAGRVFFAVLAVVLVVAVMIVVPAASRASRF